MSTATHTPAAQLAAALASLLEASMNATATGTTVTLSVAGQVFELTVAESIESQLAALKRGNALTARQAQEFDGRCGAVNARGSYSCSRKRGHTGVHVATYGTYEGDTVCDAPWDGDPAGATASKAGGGAGKYDNAAIDDRIDTADIGPRGERCRDANGDYHCALIAGHAGKHVATGGGGRILVDPWSEADKRDPFSSYSLRTRPDHDPTEGPDEGDPCEWDIRGDGCTREDGHSGNHVSGSGYGVRDWCRPGECG